MNKEKIFSTITTESLGTITNFNHNININSITPNIASNSVSKKSGSAETSISLNDIAQNDFLSVIDEKIVYPNLILSPLGVIVEEVIIEISKNASDFFIENYVIMPNHIHIVIILDQPTKLISRIIRFLKSQVTRKWGHNVWQKSFYDHIIRNEHDYFETIKYIIQNPINWINDKYYKE